MAENESQIKLESSNAKCKNCGGNIVFDPKVQKLKCANCDSEFDFDKVKGQVKHSYQNRESVDEQARGNWVEESKVVKCGTCGAEVIITGLNMTSCCPYCGSDYVVESESLPGLKPDVVIPFAFDAEECAIRFAKGIKKKFFAPRAFKKTLPKNKITGLYVPTFTFDCDTYTTYKGVLEKVEHHKNRKGETVRTVKRFNISGTNSMEHRDYVVESSSKMEGKDMNALLPFDFDETYSFTPDYIRGFVVEHYEDRVEVCYAAAQQEIESKIKAYILKKYDYTHVVSFSMNPQYSNELYSYRLLPVYSLEFDWKGKKYITMVNGQTGKIGRGYPTSLAKKILVGVLIGIAVAAIIILIMYLGSLE